MLSYVKSITYEKSLCSSEQSDFTFCHIPSIYLKAYRFFESVCCLILYRNNSPQHPAERVKIPLVIRRTVNRKGHILKTAVKLHKNFLVCSCNNHRIVSERTAAECTKHKHVHTIFSGNGC